MNKKIYARPKIQCYALEMSQLVMASPRPRVPLKTKVYGFMQDQAVAGNPNSASTASETWGNVISNNGSVAVSDNGWADNDD